MRTASRFAMVSAVASLLALGLLPAADASSQWPPPPDCTFTPGANTESLTCTNRPATQQWHLSFWCESWHTIKLFAGNTVTGNGTSTATCPSPWFDPGGEQFVVTVG